jgi:hypothetical protein
MRIYRTWRRVRCCLLAVSGLVPRSCAVSLLSAFLSTKYMKIHENKAKATRGVAARTVDLDGAVDEALTKEIRGLVQRKTHRTKGGLWTHWQRGGSTRRHVDTYSRHEPRG